MIRLDAGFRAIQRLWFASDCRSLLVACPDETYLRWNLDHPEQEAEVFAEFHGPEGAASFDLTMTADAWRRTDDFRVEGVAFRKPGVGRWADPDPLNLSGLRLAFSPEGSRLWGVGTFQHPQHFAHWAMAWDPANGHRILSVESPEELDWIAPSPDGRQAVGRPGTADELFFLSVEDESWRRSGPLPGRVHAVAWCLDSQSVAVALSDGIALVSARTGKVTAHAGGIPEPVAAIAVHPAAPRAFGVAGEMTLSWHWNPTEINFQRSYDWHAGRLTTVAISPDGILGSVGSSNGQIIVWDLDD